MTIGNVLLTPHFSMFEMCGTEHREQLGPNLAEGQKHIGVLTSTCQLLEQARHICGDHPLSIHSGYRYPVLNSLVGGSPTSQHMKGEAADFHVVGLSLRVAFDLLRKDPSLRFGQLLLEGHNGVDYTWIHLSVGAPWRPAVDCGQVGSFDGKAYHWL